MSLHTSRCHATSSPAFFTWEAHSLTRLLVSSSSGSAAWSEAVAAVAGRLKQWMALRVQAGTSCGDSVHGEGRVA